MFLIIKLLFFIAPLFFGVAYAQTSQASSPARLTLISKYTGLSKSGGLIGLRFNLKPGWHTYWENPGDTGLPAKLTWEKPQGLQIGKPIWPLPKKIKQQGFVTFGYEKETLVLFPISVDKDGPAKGEKVTLALRVDYLICKEVCISQSTNLKIDLAVTSTLKPSQSSNLFLKYEGNIPREGSKWVKGAGIKEDELVLSLDPTLFAGRNEEGKKPLANKKPQFDFFPQQVGVFNLKDIKVITHPEAPAIILPFDPGANRNMPAVGGLLYKKESKGVSRGRDEGPLSRAVALTYQLDSVFSPTQLLLSLLYAFLGGIILNLMPCVFPVLSLKAMAIAKLGEDKKSRLKHGLLFSLGVIFTFCLLGLLIVFFKEGGKALGWGFHLQSPKFVGLMIFLFIALALNFLGWYEMGLSIATFSGAKMGQPLGAFSSGVISTLVATPCTAPFMGTALGYSLDKGGLETLAVFASLGLGMALPFFSLCVIPKTNKWLPKPGAWMPVFKHLMAFPLLGTALWLLWVWKTQVPGELDVYLLGCVLLFSFGLWLYGQGFQLGGSKRIKFISLLGAVFLIGFALKTALGLPSTQSLKDANPQPLIEENGLVWEEFEKEALKQHLDKGRPVLIDFTASWCITCQVNKKIAFGPEAIKRELREKGVVLMRADWTDYDPKITQALNSYGRNSIPLNVLYLPHREEPEILPEILTASILSSYLKKIDNGRK